MTLRVGEGTGTHLHLMQHAPKMLPFYLLLDIANTYTYPHDGTMVAILEEVTAMGHLHEVRLQKAPQPRVHLHLYCPTQACMCSSSYSSPLRQWHVLEAQLPLQA